MNKKRKTLFGVFLLATVLGACSDSVIYDGTGQSPHVSLEPATPGQVYSDENKPIRMTFTLAPDNNYTENPIEALFPGQADEGYSIDDLEKARFRFDLAITDLEKVKKESEQTSDSDKDSTQSWKEAKASLTIELLPKETKKAKTKKTKKSKKSKKSDESEKTDGEEESKAKKDKSDESDEEESEDVELSRSFVSDGLLKLRTEKGKDFMTVRFKDTDNEETEATNLFVVAERIHSKNDVEVQKNPWSGTVYLVQDSKNIEMGKINGYFFKKLQVTPAKK
jgi:hypothetical protein